MSDDDKNTVEQLDTLLAEVSGLKVAFGLRQQGHLPTILKMLSDGETWVAIGAAIGWCPDTAKKWFAREHRADFDGPLPPERSEPLADPELEEDTPWDLYDQESLADWS